MAKYLRILDLMAGARNLVEAASIEKGEDVLLMADRTSDEKAIEAIALAIAEQGAEPTVLFNKPTVGHGGKVEQLPSPAEKAIKGADTLIMIYPNFFAHAALIRDERLGRGLKHIDAVATEEILASDYSKIPNEIIFTILAKIREILNQGNRLKLTSKTGTNLECDFHPDLTMGSIKNGVEDYLRDKPGPILRGKRTSWPLGTCGIVPGGLNKESANGVAVFDCFWAVPDVLREPVKYTIEKGWVVEIEGGLVAKQLKKKIEKIENANNFCEIMFGVNPKASLLKGIAEPYHMEAERRASTLHIGMGHGTTQTIFSEFHTDGMILEPTLYVNDTLLIDEGRLTVLDHPDVIKVASKYGDPELLLMEAL